MARPVTYAQPRVDTKVRLRQDHRDRLEAEMVEKGVGRNRLLEMILDDHFNPKVKGTRLAKADPAAALGKPQGGKGGHAPRMPRMGAEITSALEDKGETPTFQESPGRTRVTPRSRRIAR